jgi:hypothetical protein
VARVQIGDAKKNHRIQHHCLFLNFMRIANTEIPAPTSKSVDGSGVETIGLMGVPTYPAQHGTGANTGGQESGTGSGGAWPGVSAGLPGLNDGGSPYSKTSGGGSRGGAFGASGGSSNAMRLPQRARITFVPSTNTSSPLAMWILWFVQ